MSRIGECAACQVGDHKRHRRIVQAVPEGMMGGVICTCKGECQEDRTRKNKEFLRRMGWLPPQ